jgi:hypothetical protein
MGYRRSSPPLLMPPTKASHCVWPKASIAPPGFLVSLTRTNPPERLDTSTQSPFAQLYELLRHSVGETPTDLAV